MENIQPPGHILLILRRLKENGHSAFLVGGCVRDAVMGRPMRDWDVATSAAPLDVARLFRDAVMIGAKFGTVTIVIPRFAEVTNMQRKATSKHNGGVSNKRRKDDMPSEMPKRAEHSEVDEVQVTTFRTEADYLDGRHPAVVEFVSTLDEDLSRRDFTINAMACSVNGNLIDLFGGLDDISKNLIRCVGEPELRFKEDALRMFRAYRFRAELGFDIEQDTLRALCANVHQARSISTERIRDELEKTIVSQRPETVVEMMQHGLLDRFFPMPEASNGGLEDSLANRMSDGGARCAGRLSCLTKLPDEPLLRWCVLCAIMLSSNLIATAACFLRSLRIDEKTIKICSKALSVQKFPEKRPAIKHLIAKHGIDVVRCAAAIHDAHYDERALDCIFDIINSGECFTLHDLSISGNDLIALGYTPGPEIGKTLNKLLKHVINHPEDNKRDVLLSILK